MNNHAEPKDKRAFFPLLGSMLAEGEVIFVCLCVYVRYMKRSKKDGGGGFFWKCWERLLHGRRREGDVLSHTHNSRWKILQQQQQLKKERRHGKREKKKGEEEKVVGRMKIKKNLEPSEFVCAGTSARVRRQFVSFFSSRLECRLAAVPARTRLFSQEGLPLYRHRL